MMLREMLIWREQSARKAESVEQAMASVNERIAMFWARTVMVRCRRMPVS